jgi:hypothetical protein
VIYPVFFLQLGWWVDCDIGLLQDQVGHCCFFVSMFGGLSLANAVAFEKKAPEGSLVNVDVGIARIQTRIAKPILGINCCEICFWWHAHQFSSKWVVSKVQMVETNNSGSR